MRQKPIAFLLVTGLWVLSALLRPVEAVQSAAPGLDGSPTRLYLPLVQGAEGSTVVVQPEGQETLEQFTQSVADGQAGVVKGVYVSGVLAQPVVQQPGGKHGFISTGQEDITQFGLAADLGVLGLLAHNYLAGRKFSQLHDQDTVQVVYGDGAYRTYRVAAIERYQALDPADPYTALRDLRTDELLTSDQAFLKFYTHNGTLTFQTCIRQGDDAAWGRLFIVAAPKP